MPQNNALFPWSIKNIKAKYEYSLQIAWQQSNKKRRLHKEDSNGSVLQPRTPSGIE
jgi:hypothetical protein